MPITIRIMRTRRGIGGYSGTPLTVVAGAAAAASMSGETSTSGSGAATVPSFTVESATSHPFHGLAAEQAVGFDEQHRQDQPQGQHHLDAIEGSDILDGESVGHADDQPGDDRPQQAVEPSQGRGGEGVDQD